MSTPQQDSVGILQQKLEERWMLVQEMDRKIEVMMANEKAMARRIFDLELSLQKLQSRSLNAVAQQRFHGGSGESLIGMLPE